MSERTRKNEREFPSLFVHSFVLARLKLAPFFSAQSLQSARHETNSTSSERNTADVKISNIT
jgi:hypothetical protein